MTTASPRHILIVEDNEGDILLATEAIEEFEMVNKISVVRDGAEAISFLNQPDDSDGSFLPDLILLDINLPRVNGFEVLMHIKSSKDLRHIPVVVLTTSSSETDVYRAYYNQASSFVSKPHLAGEFKKALWAIEDYYTKISMLPG